MLFGHNTNVTVGAVTYHVQTEDRGATNALVDTTVYFQGRVLHRRTNNYFDLLPLNPDHEKILKLRVQEQHRLVIDQLRSGALNLAIPQREEAPHAPASDGHHAAAVLRLELLNPKTWLSGKRATLQIAVRDPANKGVEGARVIARVDGAPEPSEFSAETGPSGHAQLGFDMPRLANPQAALMIEAMHGHSKGRLRFQLRAKIRP